jgi:hypothetical protein
MARIRAENRERVNVISLLLMNVLTHRIYTENVDRQKPRFFKKLCYTHKLTLLANF